MTFGLKIKCFTYADSLSDSQREAVIQAELDLLVNLANMESIEIQERTQGTDIKVIIRYTEAVQ